MNVKDILNVKDPTKVTEEDFEHFTKMMQQHATYLSVKRPGRNDKCPCGSGLKYKKCCLELDELIIKRLDGYRE